MARKDDKTDSTGAPKGRLRQILAVFTMTRKADPASVWWMIGSIVAGTGIGYLIGVLVDHPIYVGVLGFMFGLLGAVAILGRRAERAAFMQIEGQKGAVGYALKSLRRGWNVEEQPIAIDPRSQDLVFRAVGRPGVVLVTEGPIPRSNRLAETERKRMNKLFPEVPVIIVNAGDGEGQTPLRKLSRQLSRKRPVLTKSEVIEVSKRLKALGVARLPIPKGVDPTRMRPDRKATRGR